jgi:3-hydroxyacyl-CoA dehydrogenase/enoyl-CoA hydratase/3-hydroxybutyryl-CoA epimerase
MSEQPPATATTAAETGPIRYQRGSDGVVTLVLDRPGSPVNTMDASFRAALASAVDRLEADRDGEAGLVGVIITSAKSTFMAGGDLGELSSVTPADAAAFATQVTGMKASLRRLETLGRPVAAVIAGAALGGGLELALATHRRFVVDSARVQLGLPEVTLGLLPGGGGTVRSVRLLGLAAALELVLEGKPMRPLKAREIGLVDEVLDSEAEAQEAARNWVLAGEESSQPWDRKGFAIPGGGPDNPRIAQMLTAAPAMLVAKTHRAMPAPERALSALVEGAHVSFDAADEIETRYFVELAAGQTAKNMIRTLFFDMNRVNAGMARPAGVAPWQPRSAAVLGGGMMGTGIAFSLATAGIPVVLKEVDEAAADRARDGVASLLEKRVSQGRMTREQSDAVLERVRATADDTDLAGVDLVVEAVFENRELKERVLASAVRYAAPDALITSNTSTLPITGLAGAVERPEAFCGLHFFSPVEKMPLVEVIRGEKSSDEAIARAFDVTRLLKKTPIVVNDSRAFFTSRVFTTFVTEGIAMVAEGVPPAAIENIARGAGFPVGPLAVSDEVSLTLMRDIRSQTVADLRAEGRAVADHPAWPLIETMVERGRGGRAAGGGFYDYRADGPKQLWSGLAELAHGTSGADMPHRDVADRLLFIQAIESVRCLLEDVVTSAAEANIGSILGIGFPPATGGVLQFVNAFGLADFVARAEELAAAYGDRFTPPAQLRERAAAGEEF